jgi:hypothetical protein
MTTYSTHLDVKFAPLELIDVQAMVDACTDRWYNQTLCGVNDAVVRLGVLQGEYHWHSHEDGDEFFLVLDGTLLIDLEDRTVELGRRQAITIPCQMRHRPRAPERTIVVMVERSTVVPTGN